MNGFLKAAVAGISPFYVQFLVTFRNQVILKLAAFGNSLRIKKD
jgi:hypothetical protein